MINEKSSVPTSCTQTESTVLPANITKSWNFFKNMQLDMLAPDSIIGVVCVSGNVGQVGSGYAITYKSGDVWELLITEVSDRKHIIAYEISAADPPISISSIQGEFSLMEITDDKKTFLQWTTEYSNDVDAQIIEDQKYKKKEFFTACKVNIPTLP